MDRNEIEERYPYKPHTTIHPGELLVEYLETYKWSQRELARRTGVSSKTVSEICNCQAPISISTALALEPLFDRPAHFWSNLQRNHDESAARSNQKKLKEKWNDWVDSFPTSDIRNHELIKSEKPEDSDFLLRFFKVSSPESWANVWESKRISLRRSIHCDLNTEVVSCWLRASEIAAQNIEIVEYDRRELIRIIPVLRKLTRESQENYIVKARNLCAKVGIALVWVPILRKHKIQGSTSWFSKNRAIISLSSWYQTEDQFWFALFHEIGHVVLHRYSNMIFVDNVKQNLMESDVDVKMRSLENEANQFAMDTLIPVDALSKFILDSKYSEKDIELFAKRQDISVGIVIGRLQYEKIIPRSSLNHLKSKFQRVL